MENAVREARARLGLTQQELGDLLDISKNYVYMLESGQTPVSKKVAAKLAALEKSKNSPITAGKPKKEDGETKDLGRIAIALESMAFALGRIAAALEKGEVAKTLQEAAK